MADHNRPNILFILTDDQGAWAMGCAGNSEIRTPDLDRLARTGTRFENFFCVSPACTPSRYNYLTGRYGGRCPAVIDGTPGDEPYRLFFNTHSPTGWFTGSVAGAPQNSREHVGVPVNHVGIRITLRRNQADVFRNVGVSRTRPLAIDDFMKVFGVGGVGRFHSWLTPDMVLHPAWFAIPYLALA